MILQKSARSFIIKTMWRSVGGGGVYKFPEPNLNLGFSCTSADALQKGVTELHGDYDIRKLKGKNNVCVCVWGEESGRVEIINKSGCATHYYR